MQKAGLGYKKKLEKLEERKKKQGAKANEFLSRGAKNFQEDK
jgi:hypothetical protein